MPLHGCAMMRDLSFLAMRRSAGQTVRFDVEYPVFFCRIFLTKNLWIIRDDWSCCGSG